MVDMPYEDFIRSRITELRMARDVSEHRMSLELGKSGSYIRGVTRERPCHRSKNFSIS